MKKLFTFIIALIVLCCTFSPAQAQFTYAEVGINGLTCSQCSRNVEMQLRKLDFAKDVVMNLQHTDGKITFTPGARVDIDRIAKAVRDAGFSVRFLKAAYNFNGATGNCFSFQGDTYRLVNASAPMPSHIATITFLGIEYLSKKEFKKWQPKLTGNCGPATGKLYYITL